MQASRGLSGKDNRKRSTSSRLRTKNLERQSATEQDMQGNAKNKESCLHYSLDTIPYSTGCGHEEKRTKKSRDIIHNANEL